MKPTSPARIIVIASILIALTVITVSANWQTVFGFGPLRTEPRTESDDALLTDTATTTSAISLLVTKVDDTNDGVCNTDCSLREAVAVANASAGEDIIQFDPTVFASPQTILLSNGALQPTSSSTVTIQGPGASLLRIKTMPVWDARHFETASANLASFTVSGVTLEGRRMEVAYSGGIDVNRGRLILDKVVILKCSGQHGGGLRNGGARVSISDSLITDNWSNDGGGILTGYQNEIDITNSTITDNSTYNYGAGIWNINSGVVRLTNVTLSNNSAGASGSCGGGGIYSLGSTSTVYAYNSIIADNRCISGSSNHDFGGTLTSQGYNLIENTTGTTITGTTTGNILGQDPMLAQLMDNGGPTFTRQLLPGSPAIDTGNSTIAIDQRGASRPYDDPGTPNAAGGNGADIGAFERQAAEIPTPTNTATFTPTSTFTPTNTSTATSTATETATLTATGTATSTVTGTPSPTPNQLLTNGSFETGDYTGWITSDLATPFSALTVRGSGTSSGSGFFYVAPTDGVFASDDGFDGAGPGNIRIAQDVSIPGGNTATLIFDYRAGWDMLNVSGSTQARTLNVVVQPFGGGTNLLSVTVLTAAPHTANTDTGNQVASVNLDAFAGQSIRVIIDQFVPQYFTGPGQMQIDNVRLFTVPIGTPTPTATASPSPTNTSTATSTATMTLTATASPSPTATYTPTNTATNTATPSNTTTPTNTATPLNTITNTATPTPTTTPAQTLVVTKVDDTNDGVCNADCSLREAIAVANSSTGDDIIEFDSNVFSSQQTILLSNGSLDITGSGMTSVHGPGANLLKILTNTDWDARHFKVQQNKAISITGVTLEGRRYEATYSGGIYVYWGRLILDKVAIVKCSAQFGGGIWNIAGRVSIFGSLFSDNWSNHGGAIATGWDLVDITNSTITNNSVYNDGGGIWNYNGGSVSLANVTISNNYSQMGGSSSGGGGVFNQSGNIYVYNTIIADNSNSNAPDFLGTLTSQGYNLIENTTGTTIIGTTTGNILGQDPMVGSLADNSGPTLTQSLLLGSPAIDKGGSIMSTDQRGLPRPYDYPGVPNAAGGNACDIGAFERQSDDMPTPTNTPTDTPTDTPAATPTVPAVISGTVTYGNAIGAPATRFVSNVLISGAGSVPVSTLTGFPDGTYSLSGFGAGAYTITPAKTDGVNGITSFDAAKIAQHVAGTSALSGNQIIVADVTGNGQIQSFDAARIAQYVAGATQMSQTGSWECIPVGRTYSSIESNIAGEDYTALLMGEVSGNWVNTGARPADSSQSVVAEGSEASSIVVDLAKMAAAADKKITVPISVQGISNKGIISYEFDLRYDPVVIQAQENPVEVAGTVSRGLSVVINAKEPGLLRVVIYGAMPIEHDGVLLNLKFITVGPSGTSSSLTWERIMFNEGGPRATVTDGLIETF